MVLRYKVGDGEFEKRIDGRGDLGIGLVGVLVTHQVGRLFIDVHAAHPTLQVLHLLQRRGSGGLAGQRC